MNHRKQTVLMQFIDDLPYLGLSLGLLTIAVFIIVPSTSIQIGGSLVRDVKTDEKVVALTLDDGPTEPYTAQTLNLLAKYDVRATFFLIGIEMERYPAAAREIVDAGHEVGNHSYTHQSLAFMNRERIMTELSVTDQLIRQAGYQGVIQFRPPYGHKFLTLPNVLSQQGRSSLMWTMAPDDIPNSDASDIEKYVYEHIRPGSIIVMHTMDAHREPSRQALGRIIPTLEKKGYRFVTVNELLTYR